MQVKQLLLKLKAFGLDIAALQNKDTDLQDQIDKLKEQVGNLDVTEAIQSEITKALEEFKKIVDTKDEAVKTAIREEIATTVSELKELINAKADSVHTHTADEITETEEKQFVSAVKKKQYDDNTIFTTDMVTVNGLGGIPAGADLNNMPVQDLLTKLLFPYVAPVVSASSNPNGGTFEKGNNQTVTKITANVTKKSEKIKKIEFLDGGSLIEAKEGVEVENGGSISITTSKEVSTDKYFSVRVTDAANKTYSANTGSFSFVYPYYQGKAAEDKTTFTGEEIAAMTKTVEGRGNKTRTYTCNNERMVFAYPKAHGVLKSIIDPNGFDNFSSFGRQEVSVVGRDGNPVDYYVYVNSPSTVTNFAMKFNY